MKILLIHCEVVVFRARTLKDIQNWKCYWATAMADVRMVDFNLFLRMIKR